VIVKALTTNTKSVKTRSVRAIRVFGNLCRDCKLCSSFWQRSGQPHSLLFSFVATHLPPWKGG